MRSVIFAALLASPLSAQSLDPRYERTGGFEGTIGDAPLSLVSLYDREKDRSMVRIRGIGGFTTVSVSARAVDADGKPSTPSISFTIGPIGAGGDGIRSDIFFNDSTGYFVADVDMGNRATLGEFKRDDTSISFAVDATVLPVKRGDHGFVRDPDRDEVTISGTYATRLLDTN